MAARCSAGSGTWSPASGATVNLKRCNHPAEVFCASLPSGERSDVGAQRGHPGEGVLFAKESPLTRPGVATLCRVDLSPVGRGEADAAGGASRGISCLTLTCPCLALHWPPP